jgi:ATP diphosphatase
MTEMIDNRNKQPSVLDDVTENTSPLQKAIDLATQAAKTGFDWPSINPVFLKMEEELAELKEAIAGGDVKQIKDELGDVLFVCSNLARHLNQDPNSALQHANDKFERRFRKVEQLAYNQSDMKKFELDYLENLWVKVKKEE